METLFQVEKTIGREVHILSTSIATQHDVNKVSWYLDSHDAIIRWSIDLLDWEKVMKLVVTNGFDVDELKRFIASKGYHVAELEESVL